MDGRLWRFRAALVVFTLWVTFLGLLAVVSSRTPPAPTTQKAQP
jgi:hypothetical protein